MRLKYPDGNTNLVDPDQTAPSGSLKWIYTGSLDLSVQIFRIFK